jgi:hypothetical protein
MVKIKPVVEKSQKLHNFMPLTASEILPLAVTHETFNDL